MAERPRFAFIDGRYVPFVEAVVPIDDRGLQFGESLYEVLAVTAGAPRLLPEHVARMARAAKELGLGVGVPPLPAWERFVAELAAREGITDGLLYAQVTGGAAPRDHVPSGEVPKTFFAYLTPFRFPTDEDVVRGIRAVTLPDVRWGRRDLKTTMLLPSVLAKREARRRGATEAILVGPNGDVYEGASSNVFLVESGAVVTPAQSTNLLPGTMRPLVVEVAREAGLEARGEPVALERLRGAAEIFISSTSQLVMPVVALDDRTIGSGEAGPIARDLAGRLRLRLGFSGR
jgi:D-alanine transaminase